MEWCFRVNKVFLPAASDVCVSKLSYHSIGLLLTWFRYRSQPGCRGRSSKVAMDLMGSDSIQTQMYFLLRVQCIDPNNSIQCLQLIHFHIQEIRIGNLGLLAYSLLSVNMCLAAVTRASESGLPAYLLFGHAVGYELVRRK